MAEKKIVGKLVNQVMFETDRASLNKALADIKKVKEAMKGSTGGFKDFQKQNQALKQQTKEIKSQARAYNELSRAHTKAIIEDNKRAKTFETNLSKQSARRMSMTEADRYGLTSRFGSSAGKRFDSIASAFRNGSMDARMYRQQVAGIRRELSAAANAQRGFNGTMKDMRSAFVQATASYTAFSGLMGMADVGKRFESRQAGMLVATGNKEDAANQIAYLDNQIRRLGLDVDIASKGFVQLGVAGKGVLSQNQIRSVFQGLSELGTAVQLDPMRYEKAILAISQMMN